MSWDRTEGSVLYVTDLVQSRIDKGWEGTEALHFTLACVDIDLYTQSLKDGVRWGADLDEYLTKWYSNPKCPTFKS